MTTRGHGIGMWIVVNEEFHDDPLTEFVAPPRPYAGNRDIFVFVDAGQAGLRKLAITGYAEESLKALLRIAGRPRPSRSSARRPLDAFQAREDRALLRWHAAG